MKKYYFLLSFFISLLGLSQEVKTVKIINPLPISPITGFIQNTTGFGLNDGAITLNPISGGTFPYSVSWSNVDNSSQVVDPNQLKAGKYKATVTDSKGCSISEVFTVNEPKLLTVTIDPQAIVDCFGGKGALNAKADGGYPFTGIPNYTYNWFKCDDINGSNARAITGTGWELNNVEIGFYMVTAVDNQNPRIASHVIELKQNPQLYGEETITHATCLASLTGTINITPKGGSPNTTHTIVWDDDDTTSFYRAGLGAGTYRYTIYDGKAAACSSIKKLIIIEEPDTDLNVVSSFHQPTLADNDGQITLSATGGIINGQSNSYTYKWSKVGDPLFDPGNVTEKSDLSSGIYNILVTSSSGCTFPTITMTLEALNIKNYQQENIKCFGASTGSISVEASGGTKSNDYQYKWFQNGLEIPGQITNTITGIPEGTYTVEVTDDLNITLTKTYIITTEPLEPLRATTVASTDVICFGENTGTITLDIKGGVIPYSVVFTDINEPNRIVNPSQLKKSSYSYVVTDKNGCEFLSPQNIIINQNDAVSILNITQKQPTIDTATDGEITITANGGTGNYIYIIKKNNVVTEYSSNTISALGNGDYEVSVKDSNGCITTQTIILKALAVTLTEKIDVACYSENTGSIEVLASGGTPVPPNQYIYEWFYKEKTADVYTLLTGQNTNKAVNLITGFYKVIVTDNVNISRELEIPHLTERPEIKVSYTATNVNCFDGNDGTITLTIEGGTGAYTVTWKDIMDNNKIIDPLQLIAGEYTFTVTDVNGCSYDVPAPIKITQPLKPLIISSFNKTEASGYSLKNGSIEILVSDGTAPYTYQWYQGTAKTEMTGKTNTLLDQLAEGVYSVIVTDKNLCTIEATYTIYQPDELLITAITETQSIKCYGNKEAILEATITGGAPIGIPDADKNYIYKWYNELNPSVIVSTTNPSETLKAGTYFLIVDDGYGNSYTSNKTVIVEPTPIKIAYTQTNASCKNQQDGSIRITTTGGTGTHTITWSKSSDADPYSLSNLFAGNYSVTVRDQNNCIATQDFVITEPDLLAIKTVLKTPPSSVNADDASIAVTVQGGTANYNFKWYDKDMNLIYTDNNQSSNTSIYNIYAGQYFITVTDANGCSIITKDLDQVDPLLTELVQINTVQCFGDANASIKALTSGGLPEYSYKWYDSTNPALIISEAETLINVKAGTYYVVTTDSFNKTIQSNPITISEPQPLDNSLSADYVRCGDGKDWTIRSNATEGTAPFTYLWNTGDTTPDLVDVVSGNYTLTVTDKNGCSIIKSINFVTPKHLDASEVIKIPTCYEGSDATITVTTIYGTAPFKYLWNTGETSNVLKNATAGEYSVEITDARGCIILRTYSIENPPKDVIDLGPDVTLCFDQTLTINATIDDDKATYLWTSDKGFKSTNAMITVSEPADYTVVVTNKLGCNATDAIKILSQQTAVNAEFAVSSQVFKNEKIIIVDISNPAADTVEWVIPANATIISKNNDFAEISFSQAGEYDITLNTTKGNCTAYQTKTILVTEEEYEEEKTDSQTKNFDLTIYPNPSAGNFKVDVKLDKIMQAKVKVYSLNNNILIDSKTDNGKTDYQFDFSLSGLPSGVYFVLFESQQGSKLRKIIIQ